MGKPRGVNHRDFAQAGSIPGEVKHLSTQWKRNRIDTVSSGERKRQSLNLFFGKQLLENKGNREEHFEF